jgi:peptide/nickel transport system substrate-binding protein
MFKKALAMTILSLAATFPVTLVKAQQPSDKALVIAEPFEPQTLDPTTSTTDLVTAITQNVFEPLYAFDANWEPAPILASALPTVSADGKIVTIPLRKDVKFQNGQQMKADDVVASLNRWEKLSPRGKLAADVTESIKATDDSTVEVRFKQPFASFLSLLSFFNSAAAIMPKDIASASMDGPIRDIAKYVGTGPYQITEHRSDQYIRLQRFDGYVSPPGAPSGFAGKREALVKELRFVPVPNGNTRLEGVLSGQYDVADALSSEFYDQLKSSDTVNPVIAKPGGWILLVLNNKQGPTTNIKFRQAVEMALDHDSIMMAAFGNPDFYSIHPGLYQAPSPFQTNVGAELFNQKNLDKAKQLLSESGYKGEPFRIITSQQYDFVYKAALVAAENLRSIGVNVQIVTMDWASVLDKRNNPSIWEGFITFHGFVPDPSLFTILNPTYAGWWDTPEKRAALDKFNTAMTAADRTKAWTDLEQLFLQQAPTIQIGEYYTLLAASKGTKGFQPLPSAPYWNVSK